MTWTEIMTASFGIRWGDKPYENDHSLWARELQDTVYGWRDATTEQIEKELCAALRYVSDMEPIPRADPSQKSSKYNCRDVRIWVYRHREASRRQVATQYVLGVTSFTKGLKRHLMELVDDGKITEARSIAEQPFYPENPNGIMQYEKPHRYTQEERDDLNEFLSQLTKEITK